MLFIAFWTIRVGSLHKAPAVDNVSTRPLNRLGPLRISELSEGVTVTNLATTQAIFRGKGEVVSVSDEEAEKPQTADQGI